jgi:Polyketide cyclase / dehydrase and lipid transport
MARLRQISIGSLGAELVGNRVGLGPRTAPWSHDRNKLTQRGAMAKAYYSTIFRQSAPEVWKIIRDFNNYPVWVDGAGASRIEDGKSGDAVGAIRNVDYQGRCIRQRLLALSDVELAQTYAFCGEASLPVEDFLATLRVTPVIDGNRAFVEWWATFDCDPSRRQELTGRLRGSFATWLESLRKNLEEATSAATAAPAGPSLEISG